jgi:hypothetical protein
MLLMYASNFFSKDIGEFQLAIHAVNQILEEQPNRIDLEVISILCSVVTKDIADAYGTKGSIQEQ